MAPAFIHRPVTAEERLQTWASPCEMFGGQGETGIRFSPSTTDSTCQYYFVTDITKS